jgi:hypothetical protein
MAKLHDLQAAVRIEMRLVARVLAVIISESPAKV